LARAEAALIHDWRRTTFIVMMLQQMQHVAGLQQGGHTQNI
jgi:hypothetical protein